MLVIDTIPKELFLLVGTVLGGVLALAGSVLRARINSRTQLKLARETHRQQYQLEALKVQAQAEREEEARIREKFEEVHQLLSKIRMEYSLTASYIDLERGITKTEYYVRYLDCTIREPSPRIWTFYVVKRETSSCAVLQRLIRL